MINENNKDFVICYLEGNLGDDVLVEKYLSNMAVDKAYLRGDGYKGSFTQKVSTKASFIDFFNTDRLVFVGGSIFGDTNESTVGIYLKRFLLCLLAKGLNKKIVVLGVNLGPFRKFGTKVLCASILSMCNYLQVRDRYSYNVASFFNSGVVLAKDPADDVEFLEGLISDKDRSVCTEKGLKIKNIGVSLVGEQVETNKKIISRVADEAVDSKVRVNVVFYSFCDSEGDYEVSVSAVKELKKMLPNVRFEIVRYENGSSLSDVIFSLSRCDVFVGGRFHSLVFAKNFCESTVLFSYSEKTVNYFSTHYGVNILDGDALGKNL